MASMFKQTRINKIKEILAREKQIDVARLSEMLDVSEVTVRSYLETLEDEGFIIRTHGGAILNEAEPSLLTYSSIVSDSGDSETRRSLISQIAQCFIKENDVIFLGAGDLCATIAHDIPDTVNITIITNNLLVASVIMNKPNVTLILAGGRVDAKTRSTVGNLAISGLQNLFIDKAFIEVNGIDIHHGYSVNNMETVEINNALLKASDEVIIVAPEDRFDKTSLTRFAPLTVAKKVITTSGIPNEYKSFFFDNNVQIFTSYDFGNDGI